MCFLREPWLRGTVEEACRTEGLEPVGWRDVPLDVAALGSTATASMPRIAQLVLAPCPAPDAELRAYRARRRAERLDGVYVASLSFRTVTYKALCAATQLRSFYPDLADPGWAAPWAIFHQRFSTNTAPSWSARSRSGSSATTARSTRSTATSSGWRRGSAREGSTPISRRRSIAPGRTRRSSTTRSSSSSGAASTSAKRSACSSRRPGRTTPRARRAARDAPVPRDARRALGRPGRPGLLRRRRRGAALDRNGLRPLRIAVCDDGLVAVSSEAGAVPLPDGAIVRRGGSGPASSCRSTRSEGCSSTAS